MQTLRVELTRSCARRDRNEADSAEAEDEFDGEQDAQVRDVLNQIRQRVDFSLHPLNPNKWVYHVRKRNNRLLLGTAASSIAELCRHIQERFGANWEEKIKTKTRD